jgi:EF hand
MLATAGHPPAMSSRACAALVRVHPDEESTMFRHTLTAAAVLLALGAALPASAQQSQGDVVVNYHAMMKMADKNNDGMVSRQEFMEAMASLYDMHMKKMKTCADKSMVKGEMLSAAAIRKLFMELYPGP